MRKILWRPVLIAAACLLFVFAFGSAFRTPKVLATALLLLPLSLRSKRASFSIGLLVLLSWPIASFAWSVNPWDFVEGLLLLALYVLALLARPLNEVDRDDLSAGLALAGVATVAYLFVQRLGWDPLLFEQGPAAGSFFGNLNFSAHFLLLCLCFLPRRFPFLVPAILAPGILLCASRGTTLALLVVTWVWLRAHPRRFRVLFSAAVLIGLLSVLYVFRADLKEGTWWLTHPTAYSQAFKQQPELISERDAWFCGKRLSLMTRMVLINNSSTMIGHYGLFGTGLGQFEVSYPLFAQARMDDMNMSSLYRAGSAHNLLLDVAIQFGIPWLLLALFVTIRFFLHTRDQSRWWTAVLAQALIALFSLNYLNPMILVPLILLAPDKYQDKLNLQLPRRLISCVLVLLICAIAFVDLLPHDRPAFLFPENHARSYYSDQNFDPSINWQIQAFLQDPYGPETLYNLGLAAEQCGEKESEWKELALLSLVLNSRLNPNYRHVQQHLTQRYQQDDINRMVQRHEDLKTGISTLRQQLLNMKRTPLLPYR